MTSAAVVVVGLDSEIIVEIRVLGTRHSVPRQRHLDGTSVPVNIDIS
jgi:hypothetical protein